MRLVFTSIMIFALIGISVVFCHSLQKRDSAATELKERFKDFRDNCFPQGSGKGCRCTTTALDGTETSVNLPEDELCKKPVELRTAENKKKLNDEFRGKVGGLRENCFPRPSGKGCRCSEKDAGGREVEKKYETDAHCKEFRDNCFPHEGGAKGCRCTTTTLDGTETTVNFADDELCKKPIEFRTAENKKKLNEEFRNKFGGMFGGLRENCFPRPSGKGCRCNEKDADGREVEKKYETDADCKVNARTRRGNVMSGSYGNEQQRDQNVRDPVREKAQQNYAAVLNELKDKFRGLREGCYPRPKGCLCVIGKNAEGREITERRMKDVDCKCRPNEQSRDCPAPGA